MDNNTVQNTDAMEQTKITKFPTPFTIESLIANHQNASTQISSDDHSINSLDVSEELSARAMVASSALGLTNFPLYNPWLHGYFAQNHDRITQLFANGGEYNPMPLSLISKDVVASGNENLATTDLSLAQNPQTLNLSKSSSETTNQLQQRLLFNPSFGLNLAATNSSNSPAMSINEALLHQSALVANDLSSRQHLAEMMAASALNENIQNLNMANRFAQNMGKVLNDAAALKSSTVPQTLLSHHLAANPTARESSNNATVKNHSEASLDVGGMDEDYDCSGDSCSDISLTMSPQNYRNEMDKSRGKLKMFPSNAVSKNLCPHNKFE